MISRPADATEYPAHYHRYVTSVPDGDVLTILQSQYDDLASFVTNMSEEAAERPYAPGKWTTKDVLLHISDTERIMAYRALRAARGDSTALSGFDQDAYVKVAGAGSRTIADLLGELAKVRASTIAMFRGLDGESLARSVTSSGSAVSARALAYIITGHELVHLQILREHLSGSSGAPN